MGITDIWRRIQLFSSSKTKSFEYFSKQPTQLIVQLNSSLRHIIVTYRCRTLVRITNPEGLDEIDCLFCFLFFFLTPNFKGGCSLHGWLKVWKMQDIDKMSQDKFSCMFLNPNNFFHLNSNCSNLLYFQEQVEKAFRYQKLFWPHTIRNGHFNQRLFWGLFDL